MCWTLALSVMGTAVLFPQDCLRISKSRHGNNLSDAFSGLPLATDSTFQLFDSRFFYPDRAIHGLVSYDGVGPFNPQRTRNCFALSPLHREVERRKPKYKRLGDPRDVNAAVMAAPNSAFTILQRPKDTQAANELIARVLTKSYTSRFSNGISESRLGTKIIGTKPCKNVQNGPPDKKKKSGVNGKKGSFDAEMGRSKFQVCNMGLPKSDLSMSVDRVMAKGPKGDKYKHQNDMTMGAVRPRRSCENSCDYLMPPPKWLNQVPPLGINASLPTMNAAESNGPKGTYANRPSKVTTGVGAPTSLRRASTDPQIVEQLGQYRSQVLETPCGQGKPFTRTTSLPIPEKWAGPAYSASPAPSSLPLPKFSLSGQKVSSFDVSSLLVERPKSNITKPLESGSVPAAPGSLHVEGELDVAYATKNLRRMLKLDPS